MSAHQSKPIVVIVCPESGEEREGVRGRQVTLPLTARRGGAKQPNTLSLHLSAERRTGVMPVKNSGRSFKATGWLNTRTSRVNDANQSTRFVRKVCHVSSLPVALAFQKQFSMGQIPDERKVTARTGKLTARGGNVSS